jgi:hypothetical protein
MCICSVCYSIHLAQTIHGGLYSGLGSQTLYSGLGTQTLYSGLGSPLAALLALRLIWACCAAGRMVVLVLEELDRLLAGRAGVEELVRLFTLPCTPGMGGIRTRRQGPWLADPPTLRHV